MVYHVQAVRLALSLARKGQQKHQGDHEFKRLNTSARNNGLLLCASLWPSGPKVPQMQLWVE